MTVAYTKAWRDKIRPGALASAAVLAPIITALGTDIIDVGCGEGHLVQALNDLGRNATGVDGPWVPDTNHVRLDQPPYPNLGRFDVAVCLEVAEHIPAEHATALVGWLCALAPVVVFSAAIPGQGGVGHVNEQWPDYWARVFAANHYGWSDRLRGELWDDDRVEPWYRQNILLFGLGWKPNLKPWPPSIVHPDIWSVYR